MEITKEIYFTLAPVLLGVITYLLRSLLSRFDILEREVKEFLIQFSSLQTRVTILEERIKSLEQWSLTSSNQKD